MPTSGKEARRCRTTPRACRVSPWAVIAALLLGGVSGPLPARVARAGPADAGGGEAGATSPSPATRPRLSVPPGFVRVDVGTRRFLLRPDDEAWVRRAAGQAPPATRPTTLPTDILTNIEARRAVFVERLAGDLDVPPSRIEGFLDGVLVPELRELVDQPIASVAMVATRAQYRQALESGWEVPAIRFNRVSGEVLFVQTMVATSDPESAEALVPFLVLDEHTEDQRVAKLAQELSNLDESALRAAAQRAQFILQARLLRFIGGDVLNELKIPQDAEWVVIGITGCLTAKYTSLLSGMSRRAIVEGMTAEPRRAPPGYVRAASIDLVTPLDVASLRPNAVVPYLDAVRRKSVAAIEHLLFLHGDELLPRLIRDLRSTPPANSRDVIRRIAQLSGTDLTAMLQAIR